MKEKALRKDSICEFDLEICCRDCEQRRDCPEVCDGVDEKGCEKACEWRIEG